MIELIGSVLFFIFLLSIVALFLGAAIAIWTDLYKEWVGKDDLSKL